MLKSSHLSHDSNIYMVYGTLDSVYMIQCVFELTPFQPKEYLKRIVHKNHNLPALKVDLHTKLTGSSNPPFKCIATI